MRVPMSAPHVHHLPRFEPPRVIAHIADALRKLVSRARPSQRFAAVFGGAWSAAVTLALFSWALWSGRPLDRAMTMTFATLVLIEFFKAYSFRSDRHSILQRPWANKWLNLAIVWELLLLVLVVNVPFLQHAFGTTSLAPDEWLLIAGAAFTIVPALELAKQVARRRANERHADLEDE
jgi:magnesium-transporting ATPase (P-type)